ncbi:MAG: class II fructose-bisphosphate aldolase [Spirochaetaceae bacterium]|nr:MAG: class II fructose-bisphosphate aldolase [Spirochaetaceae bacterium]
MSVVSATEMLRRATEGGYAVGAFNVTSFVQMVAVVQAATAKRAPVIIQTSVTPTLFYGPRTIAGAYRALAEESVVPVCLHLDHCTDVDLCKRCVDAGYTNIMIDGSQLSFDENIAVTREVVEYCRSSGDVSVEGELGTVSGVEDQVAVVQDDAALCPVDKAVEFVERSAVDIFAPAIGTAHGVYSTPDPKIDYRRLGEIVQLLAQRQPLVPVVIHGGTGLGADIVRRLVGLGGAKYNVSTDLKHLLIDTSAEYLSQQRGSYNPGKLDSAVRDAHVARVGEWIDLLGSAGKA